MAENHYVDSGDQHLAAEGVADHSELTAFYAEAKKEDLGPWMQEDERQAAMEEKRYKAQTGLRKSSVLIGFGISMPVVLGILLEQLIISQLHVGDVSQAGPLIFIIILLIPCFLVATLIILKQVTERFHAYSIRALPITFTTLLSLLLISPKVFGLSEQLIGGTVGYGIGLVTLVIASILISTVTIFVWTIPKVSGIAKLLVLTAFLACASAVFYLA